MQTSKFPTLFDVAKTAKRYRYLIGQLVRKELHSKYRRSSLGLAWVLIHPILMLSAYTLVFGVLMKARWGGAGSSLEFALVLQAGLLFFNFFSEVISKSTSLVRSNQAFVTKMVFPMEILSWVVVFVALIELCISILVWMALHVAIKHALPVGVLAMPLIVVPFVLACLGLSWFLAAASAFHSDLEHVMPALLTLAMFISPLLFPAEHMPEQLRFLIKWNPLSYILEWGRAILLAAKLPGWRELLALYAVSLLILWAGLASFRGNEKGFADVI